LLLRSARAVDRVLGWLAPRVVQAALNPAGEHKVARFGWTFAPGDKVMQMENDYDKGEVLSTFDGRSVTYGFDTLVPAYAATIHKSQGSEYPAVIIPVLTCCKEISSTPRHPR
jgi:exodeoxyribonuclease V alpha subunit